LGKSSIGLPILLTESSRPCLVPRLFQALGIVWVEFGGFQSVHSFCTDNFFLAID